MESGDKNTLESIPGSDIFSKFKVAPLKGLGSADPQMYFAVKITYRKFWVNPLLSFL